MFLSSVIDCFCCKLVAVNMVCRFVCKLSDWRIFNLVINIMLV